MTRRRAAALAAVILVPVAILAIVLGSLIGDDDSGKPAGTTPKPTPGSPRPGATGPTSPPAGTTSSGSGGAQAPNVRLPVLDKGEAPKGLSGKLDPASSDGTIALAELRGTPIVLNLWSADCTPCRAETGVLQSEWDRLGRRGVLFLGLNVLDSPAAAQKFRKQYGVNYPSVEEKRADTAHALGATGVPETFFISKDGKIAGHVIGQLSLGQLEVGIRAAQTGEPIPTDQGGGQIPLR